MARLDDWLTVAEAAELKGVPQATVRQRIGRKRLPAVKKSNGWLIRRRDLDVWEVQRKNQSPQE